MNFLSFGLWLSGLVVGLGLALLVAASGLNWVLVEAVESVGESQADATHSDRNDLHVDVLGPTGRLQIVGEQANVGIGQIAECRRLRVHAGGITQASTEPEASVPLIVHALRTSEPTTLPPPPERLVAAQLEVTFAGVIGDLLKVNLPKMGTWGRGRAGRFCPTQA